MQWIIKWVIAFAIAGGVSGCASLRMPELASCDGSEKRALNRSLWNWQERADLVSTASKC